MTQPSSQKLADAIAAEPCAPEHEERRRIMAQGAMRDHYHEYFGHGPAPLIELHDHCLQIGMEALGARVCEGEFNGTQEEANAYFASPEGQRLAAKLPASLQALLGLSTPPVEPGLAEKAEQLCTAIDMDLNAGAENPATAFLLLVAPLKDGKTGKVALGSNMNHAEIPGMLTELLKQMAIKSAMGTAAEMATSQ